jgi:ATP-dependent Clp protease ATP-binding subunit ClpA
MRGTSSRYTYERLEVEVRDAIESSLRPELVGRLQRGIIVFDALSAESVDGIARKALRQIALSARRQAGLEISVDDDALLPLIERELLRRGGDGGMARALVTGGRAIEAAVGDVVAGALQEWIVENDPNVGSTLTVTSDGEEVLVDVAR